MKGHKLSVPSVLIILFGSLTYGIISFNAFGALSAQRISRIHVEAGIIIPLQNRYFVNEEQVKKVIPIQEGDVYDPVKVEQTLSYLKKWGRFSRIDLEKRTEKGGVAVLITLQQGLLLSNIDIKGTYPFLENRLRRTLSIHPGEIYLPEEMPSQIDKLRNFYDRRGFQDTRIELDTHVNPKKGTVNLKFTIHRGYRYRFQDIDVHGNTAFPKSYFLSQLNPLLAYEPGRFRQKIDKMRKDYMGKGYLSPRIRIADLQMNPQTRRMHPILEITEGNNVSVVFKGNAMVSRRTFKSILPMFTEGGYNTYDIEASQAVALAYYKKLGYEDATVSHERQEISEKKLKITFLIHEGWKKSQKKAASPTEEAFFITSITFDGLHRFNEREILQNAKLRAGNTFTKTKLAAEFQKIALLYANAGYPYTVVTQDLTPEGALNIHVEEGPAVHVGEILVVGNERSSEKDILKSILFKKGDLFSYQKVIESERQLRRTGSYRSANIETIGLAEKSPEVHLLVKLEEFKKILLDLGVAYNTDTNFTGTMSISNVNVFGTNRRASLNLTMGQEIQKGEAVFRDPHFLGGSLVGTLSGKIEKQIRPGFTTVDAGNSFSVLKEFSPQLSLLGRYEITQTFFSNVTDETGALEEDHTTSKFSFSTSYDKRDSFSDPRKGYILLGGFDISNKIIASTFNFIQPRGYFAHFLPLVGPFTLMNFVRVEGIKVFGGDDLTRDRKLFLGGDYSIRGFDEDAVGPLDGDSTPLGGQFLLMNTVELHTKLLSSLKLALFFDNGSLTDNLSDLGKGSFRQSGGAGLRYITPVGPLRLDYGIKLDRKPEESLGRLHFAFGYSF